MRIGSNPSASSPYVVGLAGGIGVGKSVVARAFALFDIPCFSADAEARQLMTDVPDLRRALIAHFGELAYLPSGDLNRNHLSTQIFADEKHRYWLETQVHGRVRESFLRWSQSPPSLRSASSPPYVLYEAAILLASPQLGILDKLLWVKAGKALRISRIQLRDPQRGIEEIRRIIAIQEPEETHKNALRNAYHIDNGGDVALWPQIQRLHAMLSAEAAQRL